MKVLYLMFWIPHDLGYYQIEELIGNLVILNTIWNKVGCKFKMLPFIVSSLLK